MKNIKDLNDIKVADLLLFKTPKYTCISELTMKGNIEIYGKEYNYIFRDLYSSTRVENEWFLTKNQIKEHIKNNNIYKLEGNTIDDIKKNYPEMFL